EYALFAQGFLARLWWLCARLHSFLHLSYGSFHADKDGASDDAVADVELHHARDADDMVDVFIGEAVAQVHVEPMLAGKIGGLAQERQLALALLGRPRLGETRGLNFHRLGAEQLGNFDLPGVGIDEEG